MAKKISKIHARLLGLSTADSKKTTSVTTTVKPIELKEPKPSSVSVTKKPKELHVAWMSLDAALHFDSEGYAIISIGDPDRKTKGYPTFKSDNVLYLDFNPTFELDGWINREHAQQIREFYDNNKDKNILVHCSYGSQRSPGIAFGICEALIHSPVHSRTLYKWTLGIGWKKIEGAPESYDARCASVAYSAISKSYGLDSRKE